MSEKLQLPDNSVSREVSELWDAMRALERRLSGLEDMHRPPGEAPKIVEADFNLDSENMMICILTLTDGREAYGEFFCEEECAPGYMEEKAFESAIANLRGIGRS